jgi:hypothetical protein
MDDKKRDSVVAIWKTVVDVQMHFNDIEMKIRGLFVTIVLALAAAEGFLIDKGLGFSIGQLKILYATFMPLFGIIGASLFYFIDRYWYHRLLIGAVKQGAFIEGRYLEDLPELSLTAKIGEESPVDVTKWTSKPGRVARRIADFLVTDGKYHKNRMLHSDAKIELFYKTVGYLFLVLFIVTAVFIGVLVSERSLAEHTWHLLSSVCFRK